MPGIPESLLPLVETNLPVYPLDEESSIFRRLRHPGSNLNVNRAGMSKPYGAPRRFKASGGNPARLVEPALKIRDKLSFTLRPGHRLYHLAPKEDLQPI